MRFPIVTRTASVVRQLLPLMLVASTSSARDEIPFAEFGSVEEARAVLETAYDAAEAVTTLPATLAAERAFYESIITGESGDDALGTYEVYVRELWRIANYAAVVPERALLDTFDTVCIGDVLSDCQVTAAGWINGESGTPRIAWQTRFGATAEEGLLGGVILLEPDGAAWRVFAWDFRGYRYDAPRLSELGFLQVPGYAKGTGGGRPDLLFARDGDGWTQIELETWRAGLAYFLPDGLEIWQGVDYKFDDPAYGLSARSPLWRPNDGNCCPSGGDIYLVFERRGTDLIITEAEVDPAQ
jgi:hypothetical protein